MDRKSERMTKLFAKVEKKFSNQPKDSPLKRLLFYFFFREAIARVRNEFLVGVDENDVERVMLAWEKLRPFFCVSEWDGLKRALDNGSRDVLALLLSYNFRFNKSLIDYATRFRKYEEAEMLLSAVSFNNDNFHDSKFLWTATAEGKLRFIRKAVERGANSQRAMMCALLFKRKDIILFLLSSGSNIRGWNVRYYGRLIHYLVPDGCSNTSYIKGSDGLEDSFQMSDEEKLFHYEQIVTICRESGHDLTYHLQSLTAATMNSDLSGFRWVPAKMKSLKDICRMNIRRWIAGRCSSQPAYITINLLPVPKSIMCYLRFKEFETD